MAGDVPGGSPAVAGVDPLDSVERERLDAVALGMLGDRGAATAVIEAAYASWHANQQDTESKLPPDGAYNFLLGLTLMYADEHRHHRRGRGSPSVGKRAALPKGIGPPAGLRDVDLTAEDVTLAVRSATIRSAASRIQGARASMEQLQAQIDKDVALLRSYDVPWKEIGRILGVTPQSAHRRYRPRSD